MDLNQIANKIYDVLVEDGKASKILRIPFVDFYKSNQDNEDAEWLFQGLLGKGGKYYLHINEVNCFIIDDNEYKKKLKKKINQKLKQIKIESSNNTITRRSRKLPVPNSCDICLCQEN